MILGSLNALYDRLSEDESYEIAPPGYSLQKVTFKVVLTPDGELFDIEDARRSVDDRRVPRQVVVPGSTKPPGAGINPCFLWDNTGYMLGFKPEDEKPDRTRTTFEAFRDRHLVCEEQISASEFAAVCRFLGSWDPDDADRYPVLTDAATTGFGVFQIQGQTRFVHQVPEVARWWQQQSDRDQSSVLGQCLVSGKDSPLARIHEKIRGVVGAQGAGGSIVGFNEDAYESYGKSQSFNAPVSNDVAFRYVTALNALLDGPMKSKHRLTLGDMTVAFWTDRPAVTEDIFVEFATEGSNIAHPADVQDEGRRQRVERFLRAVRDGKQAVGDLEEDPRTTAYYLLGLSPNSARIAVRFFHRGTVADLIRNLRAHHQDIGLPPPPGRGKRPPAPEFPPMWMLLAQTARETKDIPPILAGPLLRSIVVGSPYPHGLYVAVLRRIQADRRIDYARACVLKGYLNRNLKKEVSMSLDLSRPDPAYRLGRLFAALEKTQKDALGESLNKTIRDGFYSSASATPGSVFPRLLRTYQHHLGKLDGGFRVNRERLIQEILDPLSGFPAQLSLPDQGLFALGYYHQTNEFYTKRPSPTEN